MILFRELAIRLFDFIPRSRGRYAEYGVEILRLWHLALGLGRRSAVPLLDDDARRSQQLRLEDIAGLIDTGDDMVVLLRRRRLGGDSFVERGIEGLSDRVEDFEARIAKRLQQLLFNHVDALDDRRRIGRRRIHMCEARDVIGGTDEISTEPRFDPSSALLPF